jgi:hypothetical protein
MRAVPGLEATAVTVASLFVAELVIRFAALVPCL